MFDFIESKSRIKTQDLSWICWITLVEMFSKKQDAGPTVSGREEEIGERQVV